MYGIRGVLRDCESDGLTVTELKTGRTHSLHIQIRETFSDHTILLIQTTKFSFELITSHGVVVDEAEPPRAKK